MKFEVLDKGQIRQIYQTMLVHDFPADEVKPLENILQRVKERQYICFGLLDDLKVISYAFISFGENTDAALLDYLAVYEPYRGKGFGSRMLTEVQKYFGFVKNKKVMIIEAESIESAKDLKATRTRENRIRFYKKNGLYEDKVNKPVICGVEYTLLYLEFPKYNIKVDEDAPDNLILVAEESVNTSPEKTYMKEYQRIYKTLVGEENYSKLVNLSNCPDV